jgi:hypothetical protein
MSNDERIEKSVAEHITWCKGERARLMNELEQFESGIRSIGTPRQGEKFTLGSLTHIAFLQREIDQLEQVIAAHL